MLEEKIKRTSHLLSCWHLGSHRCQRSWSVRWWREDPQVMSCHGDAQSSGQQRRQITFAKGRPPSSSDNSLERDAGVDRAYQMPWLTWGTEDAKHDDSDWSRLKGGEEELECPLPLDPPSSSSWVGGNVPSWHRGWRQLPANFDARGPQTFPYAKCGVDMVVHSQVEMLAWWQELWEVPGHNDHQELTWKVQGLFELPKVQCCALRVDNDHSAPPAHSSLERYQFMPPPDLQFGSQDYQLAKPQKTLTYTKALQYWVEKAQLLVPGKPHHVLESIVELCWAMEPVVSFMDEEVLKDASPSNWVEITLSQPAKPAPLWLVEPAQWDCSHSRSCWDHPRGSLSAAHGKRWPVPPTTTTTQMTSQTYPTWEEVSQLVKPESQPLTPLPGFAEIAWSLLGNILLLVITGIPAEEADPPAHMGLWDQH